MKNLAESVRCLGTVPRRWLGRRKSRSKNHLHPFVASRSLRLEPLEQRQLLAATNPFDLSTLDGNNGFLLEGIEGGNVVSVSVSTAGDVNGDNIDDLIIGANKADPGGGNYPGETYVVFGHSGGFSASLDLSTLDGTNGFRLDGIDVGDDSGFSVASAGDVNGDGFDDLIIGAPDAAPGGDDGAGETYVVFGHSGAFSPSMNLSTLNGTNGFRLDGIDAGDLSGSSVSTAGDVNGDGISDLIIGAPGSDEGTGEAYVVFGHTGAFPSPLNLATLDGTIGFRINGIDANDWCATSVSTAGDVNGDGFDDLLIGAAGAAEYAGETYVVFGHSGVFPSSLNLSTSGNPSPILGAIGVRLDGIDAYDSSGRSVSSAGDVNGDGFGDLIIGAHQAMQGGTSDVGESYVVFGHSGDFSAPSGLLFEFDLSTLDGSNGFRLDGVDGGDWSGFSVSSAGDVNGDGFGDLIIGAPGADAGGDFNAGETYVVFGGAGGFPASLDLSTLDGASGFRLDGIGAGDYSGHSVSSAGDVNGDAFDDLIISSFSVDPVDGLNDGEAYVVFGGEFTGGAVASGWSATETIVHDHLPLFDSYSVTGGADGAWHAVRVDALPDETIVIRYTNSSSENVILQQSSESHGVQAPQIDVGPDGTLHVAYVDLSADGVDIKHMSKSNGSALWSAPETIVHDHLPAFDSYSITGGAGGAWHAVYYAVIPDEVPVIRYTNSSSEDVILQQTSQEHTVQNPQIDMGPDGTLHVAYVDISADGVGLKHTSKSGESGIWSPPETIINDPTNLLVTFDSYSITGGADGTWHAAYFNALPNTTVIRYTNSGSENVILQRTSAIHAVQTPDIDMGPDGILHAAYIDLSDDGVDIKHMSKDTNPSNDANPPVAVDDEYFMQHGTTLTTTDLNGVLANDYDVDSDTFTAVLVDDVGHGSLTLHSDGTFNYIPDADFRGTDVFTYKANDGASDSDVHAVVRIRVEPPRLVKDIAPGFFLDDLFVEVNGRAFFTANDGLSGTELWTSDGTTDGTVMVKDIYPGSEGSDPHSLTNVNGTLYFCASDGTNENALWKSDGTADGTVMVKDVWIPEYSEYLTNVNGTLYFSTFEGLWKSDGTPDGTVMVRDVWSPEYLTVVNGTLYFSGFDLFWGVEGLWKSDGTADGTVMVKDIWNLMYLTDVNGTLYFRADNGTNGTELWKSDGTPAGTVMVKDINPGSETSSLFYPTNVNGTLYFSADDGTNGRELWTSDGTTAGTVMVKDIHPGSDTSYPYELTNVDGTLYFSANDGTNGYELWTSDGTPAGTVMVKDIYPGSGTSVYHWLTNVNGTLYFMADDGTNGRELWTSDGTPAGTVMFADIYPGSGSSGPYLLTNVNGTLYFGALDASNQVGLWVLDPLYAEYGVSDVINGVVHVCGNNGNNHFEFTNDDTTYIVELDNQLRSFASADVPKTVNDDGSVVVSDLVIDGLDSPIVDVKIGGSLAPYNPDQVITLVSPDLTEVDLADIADAFDGKSGAAANGTWQLKIVDAVTDGDAASTLENWRLDITIAPYSFAAAEVGTIIFDGFGGTDTVVFNGDDVDHNETAELWPDRGQFHGSVEVNVRNVESITANMGAGFDKVVFHDSPQDDSLLVKAYNGTAAMIGFGPGRALSATGVEEVAAFAEAGGYDSARFYDSFGNDFYVGGMPVGDTQYSGLTSGDYVVDVSGFRAYAQSFESAYAVARLGNDTASLYDSEHDDFVRGFIRSEWLAIYQDNDHDAQPDAGGYANMVKGFDTVGAIAARGGTDTAGLIGSGDLSDQLTAEFAFADENHYLAISAGAGNPLDYLYGIFNFENVDAYGQSNDTKDVDPNTADWLILHGWGDV